MPDFSTSFDEPARDKLQIWDEFSYLQMYHFFFIYKYFYHNEANANTTPAYFVLFKKLVTYNNKLTCS